jgi:propanol-preferring alcohol dehydrogenase
MPCVSTKSKRLGLYGFGASAHIVIQIAKYLGCEVYVFTRSENHKIFAKELGAVWTGFAEDSPPELMDCSILFAPSGKIVPAVLRALKKGGTLALAGIYMTPIPEIDYNLLYGERIIKSVTNSTRQDAIELLNLAFKIPIKTAIEVFPLKEANTVLKRLKNSKIRGSAVLEIS